MSYTTVRPETGERFYVPNPDMFPASGYLVYRDDDGRWSWIWEEKNEEDEFGPKFDTRAEVLRSVAQDWDDCGGVDVPRFTSMLRGLATRLDRTSVNVPPGDRHE